MEDLLSKTRLYIDKSFGKKLPHFERTVYWVERLKPDADEALKIAAYGHDIERAFRAKEDTGAFLLEPEALKRHQDRGSEIIYDFLMENGAKQSLAEKVKKLIEQHEFGGNDEENVLMNADSISYFENNSKSHVSRTEFTKSQIRKKFDRMFNRITSDEAKKIAEPMYEEALTILEKS